MTERLQVVDENDHPIRIATREEAWANGWILRHAYIVIRDNDNNFLLQQRSLKKKSKPGLWTWAATGHVDEGESYEIAANRELHEEVGLTSKLRFIGKMRTSHPNNYGIVDSFISVFEGLVDHKAVITVDAEEVETTRWFTPDELEEAVVSHPDNFTPNMMTTYRKFYK